MSFLQSALSFLDNPSYNWKLILSGLTVAVYAFEGYLDYREFQNSKKKTPPIEVKKIIAQDTFDKSQEYSQAKLKYKAVVEIFSTLKHLWVLNSGFYYKLWEFSGIVMNKTSFLRPQAFNGLITQSLVFVTNGILLETLSSLPFSYYKNFVLEERFGFNKLTINVWLGDLLKSLGLEIVLCQIVFGILLKIYDKFGNSFVIYSTIFFLVFQLIMMTIFPTVIAPLFNKFTPLEDGELKDAIEDLAKKQKFPVTKLFVVDGSTKSAHSNAYLVGLPWSKQIVLFDTLINHSSTEEIVAVLAHEIGHWKFNHIIQLLVFSQISFVITISLLSTGIQNQSLYSSFGFTKVQPVLIGLLLSGDIFSPFSTLSTFLMNLLTRHNEYQADSYANTCGYKEELGQSLIKLSTKNLGGITADWLYSSYHHSHPLLSERLGALGYTSKESDKLPEDAKIE